MTSQNPHSASGPVELSFPEPLLRFVAELPELRMAPAGLLQILHDLGRPDTSAQQVSDAISRDVNLSARVLRLANSAYFGIASRISTVHRAVSMLGIEQIKEFVRGLAMVEFMEDRSGTDEVFGSMRFAAHAVAVSYLAGRLTRSFGFQVLAMGEAQTAGLLHDIGMTLLGAGGKKKYTPLQAIFWERLEITLAEPKDLTLPIIEEGLLGFSHAEISGWLAAKWNLPLAIQEALFFHHGAIDRCLNKELAAVIQVAEHLSNREGLDYLPPGFTGELDESVVRFLESQGKHLSLESLSREREEDIAKAKELYGIILHTGDAGEKPERKRDVSVTHIEPVVFAPPPSIPPPPVAWWLYALGGIFVLIVIVLAGVLFGS